MMYAPYLPLRERLTVDGWIVVPAPDLGEDDVAGAFAATAAAGLARLYALEKPRTALGAFVFREGVGVGGEVNGTDVRLMHRALAIGVLDINPPPPRLGEEGTGNEGHAAMTSDNAIVYGHGIGADGYVAAEYGAMIRTLSGGYNVLRDNGMRFREPSDLHVPAMPAYSDGELVDAVHRCIAVDTDESRRLERAIGWLDLAWRNAEAITLDLRVPAVRSGFEVLFDEGSTKELRGELSALLDDDDASRTHYTWLDQGRPLEADLTELEWWFVCFTLLRNAIAHGDAFQTDDYMHEGYSHLDLGVHRLGRAIKATVVARGYPDLELEPRARLLRRLIREHGLAPPGDEPTTNA